MSLNFKAIQDAQAGCIAFKSLLSNFIYKVVSDSVYILTDIISESFETN